MATTEGLDPLNWNSPIVNPKDGTPSQYFMAWTGVLEATAGTPGPQGDPGPTGPSGPGITWNLTKSFFLVETYSDGTPISGAFTGATGTFQVFEDGTEVTTLATFGSSASGVTGGINSSGVYNVSAMSGDVGTLYLTASYGGQNITEPFTVTKLNIGIETLTSLPSTNLYEGRLVYLSTDGKLYRYHSGAWTTAQAATDLSGQVTNAQIADLAATKLTGQITNTQIADDSVTTPKLFAGSVTTGKLAAGSVVTSKLVVIPESIFPDAYFQDHELWSNPLDTSGWFFEVNTGSGGPAAPYVMGVPSCLTIGSGVTTRHHAWTPYIPFSSVGQILRLRATGYADAAETIHLEIQFYDVATTSIASATLSWAPSTGLNTYTTQVTVPAGCCSYRLVAYNTGVSGGGATTTVYGAISAIKLDVAASADLLVDGSITAIKISSDTITANEIAAGAITTNELAAGAVTAAKIAANTITASQIAAGSITANEITVGTITADRFLTNQGVDLAAMLFGTLGSFTNLTTNYGGAQSVAASTTTTFGPFNVITTGANTSQTLRTRLTVNVGSPAGAFTNPAIATLYLKYSTNGGGSWNTISGASASGSAFTSGMQVYTVDKTAYGDEIAVSWAGTVTYALFLELVGGDGGANSTSASCVLDITSKK